MLKSISNPLIFFKVNVFILSNICCQPGFRHYVQSDIPEKFLVTSKVVNMAPCSDKKEGKMEVMMKEGRKETE